MNTQNPIYFFVDILKQISTVLLSDRFAFWDVPLFIWMVGFLLLSMVISMFWRGARG